MDALASLVDRGLHSPYPAVPHTVELASKNKSDGNEMLIAWLGLQVAGTVTLPILILTMLFHKSITRRNPTVINLCIVWTLATIPAELLLYAGKTSGKDNQPSPMLCLIQAATISGVPPMAAMAYLSVVIHACTVIHNIIHANTVRPVSFTLGLILLLSGPYVSFLTFALFVAVVGSQNPIDVKRGVFFCQIERQNLTLPIFGFTLVVVVLTLMAQLWIAIMFYRNWRAKRKGNVKHRDVSTFDAGLLIRMVAFTVFEIVIIVSSVATMMNPRMGAAKVLAATPPFAVFLIFASSPDIFRAWFPCCFRRKPKRRLADQAAATPVATNLDDGPDAVTSPMAAFVFPQDPHARGIDLEKGNMTPPLESELDGAVVFPLSPGLQSTAYPARSFRPPAGHRVMRSSDTLV